jgi:hypothetical protein
MHFYFNLNTGGSGVKSGAVFDFKNIFQILYNSGGFHALLLYEDIPHLENRNPSSRP